MVNRLLRFVSDKRGFAVSVATLFFVFVVAVGGFELYLRTPPAQVGSCVSFFTNGLYGLNTERGQSVWRIKSINTEDRIMSLESISPDRSSEAKVSFATARYMGFKWVTCDEENHFVFTGVSN